MSAVVDEEGAVEQALGVDRPSRQLTAVVRMMMGRIEVVAGVDAPLDFDHRDRETRPIHSRHGSLPSMSLPLIDYFVHPFANPDLADGFGSTGYWEGGKYVHRAHPHRGLDYPQPSGAAIPATANGVVARVFLSTELGHVTVIEHHRPDGAPIVYSGYCHQSVVNVAVGQEIHRGQLIGHVGATGTEASGPHLQGPDANFNPALFINHNDKATLAASHAQAKTIKVKKGDSLWSIADKAKVSLSRVKQLNPAVKGPDFVIQPGQKIRVA
jgi:LysM repeat protein